MRTTGWVAAVGAVAALLLAVVPVVGGAEAPVDRPAPAWTRCPGPDVPDGMQCASIEVPVDWSRPTGRRIALPLARLPGTDPDRRIGVVFAVPGGPGVSGIDDMKRSSATLMALRERFDVVTFAPRNARTALAPVCSEFGPVQVPPADQDEFDAQAAGNRAALQRCRDADPELFDHLDSASVARDVDAVRAALGESRLSLMASSYGGVPAAAYARLFPARVRAAFLDGVIPHVAAAELDRIGYRTVEENFDRFADWCAGDRACALHGEDVSGVWLALVEVADRGPVPVPGAGPEAAFSGFDLKLHAGVMLNSGQWGRFAESVAAARRGDASGFATLLPLPKQPMFPFGSAVHCQDGLGYPDHAEYLRAEERAVALSPHFAGLGHALHLPCSGWTGPVADPPAPLPGDDLPPLLGAGSWGDGVLTEAAAGQVPGSVVVRYEGPGHVLYQSGNACVIEHADRYLVELRLPPVGTRCHPAG
ncbi:alpha/beta fold hydrolase [Pseudonocardia humida]|uniref:Alpha/beta fold hydrolase n=1 Tax=Pseudonocardia humida TaxID=2800819 RepID=A0ABT0ZW52_9PSEU|nr:alpha/beta fold hydrolase [Pseudonocardia humida]MCO1654958.1 alpha/beta fold hydrolase [Pseudonocardia humida]